ncbi:MAG: purine-nucleoside phosphorylase [Gemmatimonadales bacterium]|nr:purine-nucleoside phosphorylase [Gemmatimonadales bacterium]
MKGRLNLLAHPWRERVAEAVDWLTQRGFAGKVGLVLGSGLGNFVDSVEDAEVADYGEIPGYSTTSVAEHTGRLVCGNAAGVPVVVMQGRLHPYEGMPFDELLLPTAVLACLGIDLAVVTNAAGGLNRFYVPGDLMVIRDQLDLHFHDPLRGLLAEPFAPLPPLNDLRADSSDEAGELSRRLAAIGRSGGLPCLFDPEAARQLVQAAAESGVPMHSGTYASMWGPAYEAKAEIGMLRRLGCDAVGMSTAPETVLLRRLGVSPVGLSCITNPARETGQPELSHQDVVEVGAMVRDRMARLLLAFLPKVSG